MNVTRAFAVSLALLVFVVCVGCEHKSSAVRESHDCSMLTEHEKDMLARYVESCSISAGRDACTDSGIVMFCRNIAGDEWPTAASHVVTGTTSCE